jgi:peptidoglycan hydrolase CwlO-like protein
MSRLHQIKDIVSGLEDKVDAIEKTDEDKEERMKKYKWSMQELCNSIKRSNLQIMDIEEGEKAQAKSIGNVFNKVVTNLHEAKCHW